MPIRVEVNEAALRAILASPAGPTFRHIDDLCVEVETVAKRKCPRDEGRLAASISHYTRVEGTRVIGTIGSDADYAVYVHEGTGLYGPRKQRIVPISSKVLVFEPSGAKATLPKGRRGIVFARSVRGQKPQPFLREAMQEVSPYPVRIHTSTS